MGQPDVKTLYLIDGHAQFFRAYHAIRSGMRSPVTSEPTNLTFGFVGMLLKLLREYRPDYLAVVIDAAGDRETFRSQIYPEYKANREPAPDDFHPQVERCLEILRQLAVPILAEPEVEADDVIASLVRRVAASRPDLHIRIVSKDKDLAQVLSDRVELFDVHKDQAVTAAEIFKTEGVRPEHVVDILALMGDTVDNVPGVPGIGPKTAGQLILQYGSVENLLEHLDEIKGKRKENLEKSRDTVTLSRRLVKLKDDLGVELDLDQAAFDPTSVDVDAVLATFRELGLNRHQDELKSLVGTAAGTDPPAPAMTSPTAGPEGSSLFAPAADATARQPADHEYECIRTESALKKLVAEIREAGRCAVDTETDSLAPRSANLCGVSISITPRAAVYIPTRSPEPDAHLNSATVMKHLRPVLEDPTILKIGHNLKFDLNVLRRHGLIPRGFRGFDTMVASYVLDSSRSSHALDALALALLGHACIPIRDLIGTGKKQKTFDQVPLTDAVVYAAEDADITLRLYEQLEPRLAEAGLRKLFDELEMPLVEVLADLEWVGIRVDPEELDHQGDRLRARIDALRARILEVAPHPFNPDSPRQLAAVLFGKPDHDPPGLGIRPLKRGKTGPSTDQEVLERLAADPQVTSPVPQLIVEYRQLTKLLNTYLVALKEAIHSESRRVHASFHQTVAATGRLSSSDPNLQNIPIRTEVGREIRRAFVAESGHVLITADYSQIELRLLAHLSEDPGLIEAFQQGQDIHAAVAAEVCGVDLAEVTPAQRGHAKMVNFGIIYGITPYGLARRLGPDVSVEQAGEIIDGYLARFSRINDFLQECVRQAEAHGYVQTMLGRRRAIPQIHARHRQQRALGERMAINSVVQGSAADLIKLAMIDLHRRLPERFPEVSMVLQIHDELVFEAPEAQAEAASALAVERMQGAMSLRVPLVVDAAWSARWIDAKG